MIEIVMEVDDEFWDHITQLTVFKGQKEIIHCKDCSFWGTEQDGYCAAIDDPYMLETEADDFCSWGERIVRCKDCKYLHQLSDGQIFCEKRDGLPLMIGDLTADDFCSQGENR